MYFEERSSTSSLFSAYWHTSPGARDLFELHNTRSQIPSRQACNHAIVEDIRLKRDPQKTFLFFRSDLPMAFSRILDILEFHGPS